MQMLMTQQGINSQNSFSLLNIGAAPSANIHFKDRNKKNNFEKIQLSDIIQSQIGGNLMSATSRQSRDTAIINNDGSDFLNELGRF
jgi:hypothetical protein